MTSEHDALTFASGGTDATARSADELPTIPLDVRQALDEPVDLERARGAFEELDWLGDPDVEPEGHPGVRRVRTDLGYDVPSGSLAVRKAALIDVGPAVADRSRVRLEIAWRSATLAPLFPVFAGELVVSRDALELHGRYAPPFGRLGLVIDRALLHLVARGTGRAFLARAAARLQAAASR
jgi:hypothetical protein